MVMLENNKIQKKIAKNLVNNKMLKNLIANRYSKLNYPILVNSYGRSGSTLLTDAIVTSSIETKSYFLQKIISRSLQKRAFDLENTTLTNNTVYKTHDYPPKQNFNINLRMLYTFADPIDVILSLIRIYEANKKEWIKDHYQHLKVEYINNFWEILNTDQLCLEKHIDTWLNEDRFPIAFIKYETMWNHVEDISDFLGFQIKLPPYRARKSKKQKKEIVLKLKQTYEPLLEKVYNLDEFFTNF